jgi:hypothetical protein
VLKFNYVLSHLRIKAMPLIDYLATYTDKELFVILTVCFIGVSIITVLLMQVFIHQDTRHSHNEVIGNVSSLIGLIYGVLAGLTALYLINNLSYTGDAVQREANAVANLYRDSSWLKEPARATIKNEIANYLSTVIKLEWPQMKNGDQVSENADINIENISRDLRAYNSFSNSELLILHDMLDEIKALYNARETRIQMSYESLNVDLWAVILIGTVLMVSINFLFGMNIYFHIATVTATAMMAAAMIFLLITLDKPFQGDFVIEPTAYQQLLNTVQAGDMPKVTPAKSK